MTSSLTDTIKNSLKSFSEDADLYTSTTIDTEAPCEQESRILSWLNQNNIVLTNANEKMYKFFQSKREKVLEARRQLNAQNFSPEKKDYQEKGSCAMEEKRGGIKDFAKRKSLFLNKIG